MPLRDTQQTAEPLRLRGCYHIYFADRDAYTPTQARSTASSSSCCAHRAFQVSLSRSSLSFWRSVAASSVCRTLMFDVLSLGAAACNQNWKDAQVHCHIYKEAWCP